MMVVEAFPHRPVAAGYGDEAQRHETTWWDDLLALLPVGRLVVIDLGFGFEWFDRMTSAGQYVLTRQKPHVRYQVVKTLSQGTH